LFIRICCQPIHVPTSPTTGARKVKDISVIFIILLQTPRVTGEPNQGGAAL